MNPVGTVHLHEAVSATAYIRTFSSFCSVGNRSCNHPASTDSTWRSARCDRPTVLFRSATIS